MKIQKKNLGGGGGLGQVGGGAGGSLGRVGGGGQGGCERRIEIFAKIQKKKFGGGTVGRAWRVGLGGSGWM